MKIVVVGAGKMGYSIAQLLADGSYDVVVIEQDDQGFFGRADDPGKWLQSGHIGHAGSPGRGCFYCCNGQR